MEPKNNAESSHRFTLFFLVYGYEAMLPTDVEYGSPTTSKTMTPQERTPSTSLRKLAMWLCYTLQGISKVSDATTINTSVDGTSMSMT
jgi:hypothetical protein